MRAHLPLIHKLTFEVTPEEDETILYKGHSEMLSITIRHDLQRGCWTISSSDDWSGVDEDVTGLSLEGDSALLQRIIEPLLGQRSRVDLKPEDLMWLVHDLKLFYHYEKIEDKFPFKGAWLLVGRIRSPEVRRLPDMYTRHLRYSFYSAKPYWSKDGS